MPIINKKGFTLIEVMIAMFLLMVGMLAYAQLQLSAIKVNEAAKMMMIAQDVVSQEIDNVKTVGYTGIRGNTILIDQTKSFKYYATFAELPVVYQFAGLPTTCNAPTTYCVYKGIDVNKTVNGSDVVYHYTIQLAVNTTFLSYPEIAEVDATVYWMNGNTLKNMMIAGYVGI